MVARISFISRLIRKMFITTNAYVVFQASLELSVIDSKGAF